MDDSNPAIEYVSYNGMGRLPMIWGIPFMSGLFIMCVSLIGGLFFGMFIGGSGWLFTLIGIPLALFIKSMCVNDDKAIQILLMEASWSLKKLLSGTSKFHGGTLTISPITYGRRLKNVNQYFKKFDSR